MKTVIQRVAHASVTVEDKLISKIGPGLLILIGVGHEDTEDQADYLARKIAAMRIFEDENGKMNRCIRDIDGSILVVSQFTLYADCRRGNRPGFSDAAAPDKADRLYEYFCEQLRNEGVKEVLTGRFGADMAVELLNSGPVTIILEK